MKNIHSIFLRKITLTLFFLLIIASFVSKIPFHPIFPEDIHKQVCVPPLRYSDYIYEGTEEIRISDLTENSVLSNNQDSFFPTISANQMIFESWGAPNFGHRKTITINAVQVEADLDNFPMQFEIFDPDIRLHCQVDGDDIIFLDTSNLQLPHEIEYFDITYNSTHAYLVAWILIPHLSGSMNTTITMYYGNPTALNQEQSNGVWNSSYRGVWHLQESSGPYVDSSPYSNDGQLGGNAPSQIIGSSGIGLNFDGSNYISIPNSIDLQLSGEVTIETWVQIQGASGAYMGIAGKLDDTFDNGYALVRHSDNTFKLWVGNGVMTSADSDSTYTDSDWHHVVGVINNGMNTLYIDGNLQTDFDTNTLIDSGEVAHIARQYYNFDSRFWQGSIDELRILNVSKSAAWISTEYSNQFNPSSFYIVGENEQLNTNWGASTFGNRKQFILDSDNIPSNLTDFPFLFVLYDKDLPTKSQVDGDDILFLSEDNIKLDHEIEKFNPTFNATHALLVTWIRIPFLSATSDTSICMYYNNPTIGSQENPTGVWNENYVGIWHMGSDISESSSRGLNGTNQGTLNDSGQIGNARRFDGIDDYINLGLWDPGVGTGDYSISAWVKLDSAFNTTSPESLPIFGHYNTSTYNMAFTFAGTDNNHATGTIYSKVEGYGPENSFEYVDGSTNSWDGSTWIYVTATTIQSTTTGLIYKDGISEGSMSADGEGTFGTYGRYKIGSTYLEQTFENEFFQGIIDELRISRVILSSDWILTEYQNQLSPQSFYMIGGEEQQEFFPPTEQMEVIIDTDVYDATDEYNPGPNVVFINDSHGYVFFQKTNGGRAEIVYYKTVNGGINWYGPVNIDCGPPQYSFRSFSCWFDQWTQDRAGSKIHLVANSIDDDEMAYNYLDTEDDTTNGGWTSILSSGGSHNAPDGGGAVTVSEDGTIFSASWMTNGPQFAKYDTVWSDITPSYTFLDDDDDHGQLLPLGNGDILCIYEDSTSNDLFSFAYDISTNSWDTSPTYITQINTTLIPPADDYSNNANWGAVHDPISNNIYLLLNNYIYNSSSDLESWIFFENNRTWAQRSNVVTNIGILGDEVKPFYDPTQNLLIAIYILGEAIYMRNSSDNGHNWSPASKINIASHPWIVIRTNFISMDKFYAIYFDEINNDVYGNSILDFERKPENATVRVQVIDSEQLILSNASVTLMNANNQTSFWIQNTTNLGFTSFTNLRYAFYNISVEFESTINNSLRNLSIFPDSLYSLNPEFNFTIVISIFSDTEPPNIINLYFENTSIPFDNASTFFTSVEDVSYNLKVSLNLTAINTSNGAILIQSNFSMELFSGILYYNATALDSLNHRNVKVMFNIIATDFANNSATSLVQIIYLGDRFPPTIVEYNVIDYKNGTLVFYANLTDNMSLVVAPVILQVNEELLEMYMNVSGIWTLRISAHYGVHLNYTIYSVFDSIGNENGSRLYGQIGPLQYIIPEDDESPIISNLEDSISSHTNGFVEFFAKVEDRTNFQSGVNDSSVCIHLIINGKSFNYSMTALEESYYFSHVFQFNDSISYWISSFDLAGNYISLSVNETVSILDIISPSTYSWTKDWGNGTVDFFAFVTDWPSNSSFAFILFTQDYFAEWINLSMTQENDTFFMMRVFSLDFADNTLWFYVSTVDNYKNWNNPGQASAQSFSLEDKIAPVLSLLIEESLVNDGQITFTSWANDPYGSIRDINNTVSINLTVSGQTSSFKMHYDSFYFYTFSSYFIFGDILEIKIWVNDASGNIGTLVETIIVKDQSPPKLLDTGIEEYQNGTVTFWAIVEDSINGSGLAENAVRIEYVFISIFNETMIENGTNSMFTHSVSGFVPGNAFNYRIISFDNSNNTYISSWHIFIITDDTPPVCNGFGFNESLVNHSHTEIEFWADATDPFGSINWITITIDYFIYENSTWITICKNMSYSTSLDLYIYSMVMECNQTFNYYIEVSDSTQSVIISNNDLRTYWGPVIIESNIEPISGNFLRIWANVTDWGSGIDKVELFYEFINQGTGATVKEFMTLEMTSNGTLYVTSLEFGEPGTLNWQIVVYDALNAINVVYSEQRNYLFLPESSPTDISFEQVALIIGVSSLIFILLFVSYSTYRKNVIEKMDELLSTQAKLASITNIYTILVTTDTGLPVFNLNNVLYKPDSSRQDVLSGLSVGIDSFLESFQSDFISYLLEPSSRSESPSAGQIKTSAIVKNQIQILIVSTQHYKIFLFTKEKPIEFIKSSFVSIARLLEEKLPHNDFGIIDETLTIPVVANVINHFFPLHLLSAFTLNCQRIYELDKEEKTETSIEISKNALLGLKRLAILKSTQEVGTSRSKTQINSFNNAVRSNQSLEIAPLLYTEALDIFEKIIKLSEEEIFDALWKGSSPSIKIIVPCIPSTADE